MKLQKMGRANEPRPPLPAMRQQMAAAVPAEARGVPPVPLAGLGASAIPPASQGSAGAVGEVPAALGRDPAAHPRLGLHGLIAPEPDLGGEGAEA